MNFRLSVVSLNRSQPPATVPRRNEDAMSSSAQDRNPETDKFVQAVLGAFERLHFAAVAVLRSDDLANIEVALEQSQLAIDSGQRPN